MVDAKADAAGLSDVARYVAKLTAELGPQLEPHVIATETSRLAPLEQHDPAQVWVKAEHLQHTGSFKIRGAFAKMLRLTQAQRETGVIAASSGNHGLGVAHALAVVGGKGIVVVPEGASPVKVRAIQRHGTEVRHVGADASAAEEYAREMARSTARTYISPYNDLDVIAGQGTIALELVNSGLLRDMDAVVVAVGGGGLISGIASTLKSAAPHVRVIGASPSNDAAMAASVKAGRVVADDARPTISDGTAGGLEPGTITLPLCTELIDEWHLVPEERIARTLAQFIEVRHELIEGAAAVAVAAAVQVSRDTGERVAAVSCGANISASMLRQALNAAG